MNYNLPGAVQVMYGGAYAAVGQFGAWTPLGAEQNVGGAVVVWGGGSDQYLAWNLDTNGNYMWQSGVVALNSTTMQALEYVLPAGHRTAEALQARRRSKGSARPP